MASPRPHVGFVMEQTLGHVAYAQNLRACVEADGRLDATFLPVPFAVDGWAARVPGYGNWTVRAGVRARRAVRAVHRVKPFDALFVHTQVPAVLLGGWMRRVPTVVSLDATPRQYDELGAHYAHEVGPPLVERVKHRANARCFGRAAALVTWSEWAASGLAAYGVDASRVHVIPPGVRVDAWAPSGAGGAGDAGGAPALYDRVVRILFVGADLDRKGGRVLLDAFARLRARVGDAVELDVVTRTPLEETAGVRVHAGMTPNSDALRALYGRADVFCLPTLADCLPLALAEAGACGLPLVSTDVGAVREIVVPGITGALVARGDVDGLADALAALVADRDLRERSGRAARSWISAHHDASANAARLVDLLADLAVRNQTSGMS